MVDKDVVYAKINQIENCLKRITEKTQGDPGTLDQIDIQDIFVLNLQRAIQTCIDLAAHIVADRNLGLPSELRENFSLLEKAGLLPQDLSSRLQKMVGFRNIAVHEYSTISVNILKAILKSDLQDLKSFCQFAWKAS